jgi:hypothetical protein
MSQGGLRANLRASASARPGGPGPGLGTTGSGNSVRGARVQVRPRQSSQRARAALPGRASPPPASPPGRGPEPLMAGPALACRAPRWSLRPARQRTPALAPRRQPSSRPGSRSTSAQTGPGLVTVTIKSQIAALPPRPGPQAGLWGREQARGDRTAAAPPVSRSRAFHDGRQNSRLDKPWGLGTIMASDVNHPHALAHGTSHNRRLRVTSATNLESTEHLKLKKLEAHRTCDS